MLLQSFYWGCFNCLALVSLHKRCCSDGGGLESMQHCRQTGRDFPGSLMWEAFEGWNVKAHCVAFNDSKKQYTCLSINHVHDQIRDCLWLYWVLSFSKMYCIKMSLSETVLGNWVIFRTVRTVFANKHDCSLWEMEFQRSRLPCDLVSSVGLHSWAF